MNLQIDSLPLCYNFSLQDSSVPDDWKETHVCQIHKCGDHVLVSNSGPVSLLNTLNKTFEIRIKHIYNLFPDSNIHSPSQSRFISGDSTITRLTNLYDTSAMLLSRVKR